MKKKGNFSIVDILVGMMIGLVIVGIIAVISTDIIQLLPWSKESDETYFSEMTNFLVSNDKELQVEYYVAENHFIAGFSKDADSLKGTWLRNYDIRRPVVQCGRAGEGACICKCDLKDGNIQSNGCFDAECKKLTKFNSIKGIMILSDDASDAEEGELIIKGRAKFLMDIRKEGSDIIFSLPGKD